MITHAQRIERENCIGGSDMPIILGLSSYKTPYELYCEKKGILQLSEETQLQYWGKQLEVLIRKEFRKRNKVKVQTPKNSIVHPFYNFLRGNLDGFIPKWNAVFEAKSSNSFMARLWGEHGSDTVPMEYLVQTAFYCSITNADCAHIAVLIGGYDYREYKYSRDLELEKTILEAACAFWDAIKNNTPPAATKIVDLKLLFPRHDPNKTKTINNDIKFHLSKLNTTKQTIKELEQIENDCKFKILKYMEDAECLIDMEGKPLVTYKCNKKGSRTFLLKEGINNDD